MVPGETIVKEESVMTFLLKILACGAPFDGCLGSAPSPPPTGRRSPLGAGTWGVRGWPPPPV